MSMQSDPYEFTAFAFQRLRENNVEQGRVKAADERAQMVAQLAQAIDAARAASPDTYPPWFNTLAAALAAVEGGLRG